MGVTINWSPARKVFDTVQQSAPAPLEQSWNYGETISVTSFNDVRRGIVEFDGSAIATIQTVERTLPGGLVFVRLTRGPVIANAASLPDIFTAIRREYPRYSRNLLFWMPDVENAAEVMRSVGKRPMTSGYTTAWLDLSPGKDELRKGLRGNWRNALTQAESAGFAVRVSRRPEDVEMFLQAYRRDRRKQQYLGPSPAFVRTLADKFGKDQMLIQALDHGDVISASIFLKHGASATYFLSWTSDLGRETNAAHRLLWEGAIRQKGIGVRWLDLGGMDARAPGIARFKLGLGAPARTYTGTWF